MRAWRGADHGHRMSLVSVRQTCHLTSASFDLDQWHYLQVRCGKMSQSVADRHCTCSAAQTDEIANDLHKIDFF